MIIVFQAIKCRRAAGKAEDGTGLGRAGWEVSDAPNTRIDDES